MVAHAEQPDDPGSIIVRDRVSASPVCGIAGRRGFTMLNIEKAFLNKERGFGLKILQVLDEEGAMVHRPLRSQMVPQLGDQRHDRSHDGKNENAPAKPNEPTRFPLNWAPNACAQSSVTHRPCLRATAKTPSRFAGWP